MTQDWRSAYQKLLRTSSEKWGLDYIHEDAVPINETLYSPDGRSYIKLFSFNGFWGYCLTLTSKYRGHRYGSFLKFCDPYPNREDALSAASRKVIQEFGEDPELVAWARSLRQLRLF